MSTPSDGYRAYLPWLRSGLAGAITRTDPVGAPGRAAVPLRASVNGAAPGIDVPIVLSGPGDVTALDPAQVVRTVPRADDGAAQSAHLVAIDFAEPDLPWAFTPLAGDGDRLRPWLVLVVVPRAASTLVRLDKSLVAFDCDVRELPDLDESWAWAHVQVVLDAETDDPLREATHRPERALSRLLCPRRLRPGLAYRACVVPAFETGRRRGLGEVPDPAAPLSPAWDASAGGPVRLPALYYWDFTTGDGPPFEELVDALEPYEPDPPPRGAAVEIGRPDWGVPDGPSQVVSRPAALGAVADWPDAAADTYAALLRAVLVAGASPPGIAPQVRPPVYGAAAAGVAAPTPDAPRWLRELNLDPRMRMVAGLGAHLVRLQQEDLVAQVWAALPPAATPVSGAGADLGSAVRDAVQEKHLAPLSADAFLRVTDPLGALGLRRVTTTRWAARTGGSPSPDTGARFLAALAVRRVELRAAAPVADPPPAPTPRVGRPAVEWLRDVAADSLLPGVAAFPPERDTVTLLPANAAFAEALLVGMNDELGRELRWRGVPVRPGATFVNRFWSARPRTGPGEPEPPGELPDIEGWDADSVLGSHLRVSPGGLAVLLVRGALLRRFPTTQIFVAEAERTAQGRRPGNATHPALFTVPWGRDATLVGLPLGVDEAVGSADPTGPAGWFVVLEEPMEDARFGMEPAETFGGRPATWDDLSWGHLAGSRDELERLVHVPVAGSLAGLVLEGVPWGADAAAMAVATEQRRSLVAVHASVWL